MHKKRKTGKRVILEGNFLITKDEILKDLEKAENATWEAKAKKGKKRAYAPMPIKEEEPTDSEDKLAYLL